MESYNKKKPTNQLTVGDCHLENSDGIALAADDVIGASTLLAALPCSPDVCLLHDRAPRCFCSGFTHSARCLHCHHSSHCAPVAVKFISGLNATEMHVPSLHACRLTTKIDRHRKNQAGLYTHVAILYSPSSCKLSSCALQNAFTSAGDVVKVNGDIHVRPGATPSGTSTASANAQAAAAAAITATPAAAAAKPADDGRLRCRNYGCSVRYLEAENGPQACAHHTAPPLFHDTKKGWNCCEKRVYDWDEFQVRACSAACLACSLVVAFLCIECRRHACTVN